MRGKRGGVAGIQLADSDKADEVAADIQVERRADSTQIVKQKGYIRRETGKKSSRQYIKADSRQSDRQKI
jgi:hypothetical protein